MEREVGGGIGMGNTCKPMSVSFQCMTKSNTHTQKKASRGEEISFELIKILKDGELKCCTRCISKFGKLTCGHRTGKGQFSFQFKRRAMQKDVQSTVNLYSLL